jgi:hypothetical protein
MALAQPFVAVSAVRGEDSGQHHKRRKLSPIWWLQMVERGGGKWRGAQSKDWQKKKF